MNEHEMPRSPDEWERLLNDLQDGECYITQDGDVVAVILDIGAYDALIATMAELS